MPFDALSLSVIALSALLFVAATVGRPVSFRVAAIVLAALIIRGDAAFQRGLHTWDESYHALVAKNLISDPLRPTLYRRPALAFDPKDWTANHVWLHKPPGALWLMAGSMAALGVNEFGLRLPSVILSSAAVILTFLIGRALFSERVGLLAAAFHALNGFLVALAAGRRVADHVDTALTVFVELALWAVIVYRTTRTPVWLVVCGMSIGFAFLTKSLPALIVLPVAFVALYPAGSRADRVRLIIGVALVAAAVAAPWTIFTARRYPAEAAWAFEYTLMHMTQAVEGQTTSVLTYVRDLPRFFGEMSPAVIIVTGVIALRDPRQAGLRLLVVWAGLVYVAFSLMATRMPGYVVIAAPALFLMQAWAWVALRDRLPEMSSRVARLVTAGALVLMAALPARHLLEPTGPLERRDRFPEVVERAKRIQLQLGLPDAVLFNVPSAIEVMFYSPYTAYERMPTDQEVKALVARGLPVVIYQDVYRPVAIPGDWPVIVLSDDNSRTRQQ